MKTRILIKEGEYRLSKAGVMNAGIDSEELYCYMTGLDRVGIFMRANDEVSKEVEEEFFKLIEKRATRIPLQHILGEQHFMGFRFKVSPDVLIPRQETEILVIEAARTLQTMRDSRRSESKGFISRLRGDKELEVLDLCCGSGAIGISIAKICPDVRVAGADLSEAALAIAKENAEKNRVKISFAQGDMFGALAKKPLKGRMFDMIISNPPYIRSQMIAVLQDEVKKHEPLMALDGGKDGLNFYRTIVSEAPKYLNPGGYLYLEIGYDQGEDLRKMLRDSGKFEPADVIKDLPGKDRVVRARRK